MTFEFGCKVTNNFWIVQTFLQKKFKKISKRKTLSQVRKDVFVDYQSFCLWKRKTCPRKKNFESDAKRERRVHFRFSGEHGEGCCRSRWAGPPVRQNIGVSWKYREEQVGCVLSLCYGKLKNAFQDASILQNKVQKPYQNAEKYPFFTDLFCFSGDFRKIFAKIFGNVKYLLYLCTAFCAHVYARTHIFYRV